MILLTVKTFDTRAEKGIKEGAYDQAWFRLQNEDTNQALDYTKINSIDLPEGYDPTEGVGGEDDDDLDLTGERNELTYIAGRIYLECPKVKARRPGTSGSGVDTNRDGTEEGEGRNTGMKQMMTSGDGHEATSQRSQLQSRGSRAG